jgi:hypothetical protein
MQTVLDSQPVISYGNRFPYRVRLERPNALTTLPELATGEIVTAFLALTEGGTAIDNTTKTLNEIPASVQWNYAIDFPGTDVKTVLDTNPAELWVCYQIASQNLEAWAKVKIIPRRRAG